MSITINHLVHFDNDLCLNVYDKDLFVHICKESSPFEKSDQYRIIVCKKDRSNEEFIYSLDKITESVQRKDVKQIWISRREPDCSYRDIINYFYED